MKWGTKRNAFRKFTCPAACPGGTNGNSPAIHRWVWAGRRHESRRDERRLIPVSLINRGDSVVPAGLCAARPRTPALKCCTCVSEMVGMARCAVPARVVAGGTNVRATLPIVGIAPLHAARTSQRDVPTTLNRYETLGCCHKVPSGQSAR